MVRFGRMDRRVRIDAPTGARGGLGEATEGWVQLATVWARKLQPSVAAKVVGPELVSEQSVVWSVRYRADVTSLCRLVAGEEVYRIDGVYEGSGRLEELIILSRREEPGRAEY